MESFAVRCSQKEKLVELCDEMNFSEDRKVLLTEAFETLDPVSLERVYQIIFSDTPYEIAGRQVRVFSEDTGKPGEGHALRGLAIYLSAALYTKELYRQYAIPDTVFTDTLKALERFAQEDTQRCGYICFDRYEWSCRHLRVHIFRLGALEYEMRVLTEAEPPVGGAAAGDAVLSVHIPSDAVLDPDGLRDSYRSAAAFFRAYFPGFAFRCIYCDSWLLSPYLKDILAPDAKILAFQSDYVVEHVDRTDNSGMIWIFQKETDSYEELKEDNALRRGLKKRLLADGAIGSGRGALRDRIFLPTANPHKHI